MYSVVVLVLMNISLLCVQLTKLEGVIIDTFETESTLAGLHHKHTWHNWYTISIIVSHGFGKPLIPARIVVYDCLLGCSLCDIELAFLVDSSTKRNSNAWTQMMNFVSEVSRQYTISSNCVRVAVIRYSDRAEASIQLWWYGDINRLVQAIGYIQLLGGSSNLANALNLLRTQVFASHIVRPNTVRIAIIITDQLQSSSLITAAANNVKSQGIVIVGVAITGPGGVDSNFMYSITSNNWTIQVSDYSQLVSGARNTIVQQYGCLYATTPAPTTTVAPGRS